MFSSLYGIETLSLLYFNVFGPKQDPNSQYAAVIPNFITAALTSTFVARNAELKDGLDAEPPTADQVRELDQRLEKLDRRLERIEAAVTRPPPGR